MKSSRYQYDRLNLCHTLALVYAQFSSLKNMQLILEKEIILVIIERAITFITGGNDMVNVIPKSLVK